MTDELDWIDERVVSDFVYSFIKKGITVKKEIVDPNLLKRTQANSDRDKALKIITDIKNNSYAANETTLYTLPIVITRDYFVLHGHHRWYAHKHLKIEMHAYVLDTDYDAFVKLLKSHKHFELYRKIEKSRDIRIGKIFYSILEELSKAEG